MFQLKDLVSCVGTNTNNKCSYIKHFYGFILKRNWESDTPRPSWHPVAVRVNTDRVHFRQNLAALSVCPWGPLHLHKFTQVSAPLLCGWQAFSRTKWLKQTHLQKMLKGGIKANTSYPVFLNPKASPRSEAYSRAHGQHCPCEAASISPNSSSWVHAPDRKQS